MPDDHRTLLGRRVLVVEDEYLIASEMEAWLQRAGAEVVGPWPSVQTALQALHGDQPPHAGILDINLGRGGHAAPIAVRLAELGVPYLLATGNNNDGDDAAFRGRPRLEKPVSERMLMRALVELIRA